MKNLFALFCISSIVFLTSCRKDFDFPSSSQKLRFSKDTLFLDTVFNQVRSETYAIKIYNLENKDISIPSIGLRNGASSYYRINVDGSSGFTFNNIPLRKNDSLYVFVEIAPNLNPPNTALVEEDLVIQSSEEQIVKLLSLVEDVDLLLPQTGQNTIELNANTLWDNTKPKVVFGNLIVKPNVKLTLSEGAKVYFHRSSKLTIDENAELEVNGTLNNPVIFRGDRHDLRYDTLPNNWDGLVFKENSLGNLNYAFIKGAVSGVSAESSTLNIQNTQIYNNTFYGLISNNSTINGSNMVINNSADASLAIINGGNYDFKHCTFTNHWNLSNVFGPAYGLYLSNEYTTDDQVTSNPLNAIFSNCIIWSRNSNSLFFKQNTTQPFNYKIRSTLIKVASNNPYKPENDLNIENGLYNNINPNFNSTIFSNNNLIMKANSDVRSITGIAAIATMVPTDIRNVNRTVTPILGAYQ